MLKGHLFSFLLLSPAPPTMITYVGLIKIQTDRTLGVQEVKQFNLFVFLNMQTKGRREAKMSKYFDSFIADHF